MPSKRVTDKNIIVSASVPARHKPATTKRVKGTAPAAASEAPVTQLTAALPSQEQIAALAYLYWEARGCQGGSPEQDWLRAEKELLTSAATA